MKRGITLSAVTLGLLFVARAALPASSELSSAAGLALSDDPATAAAAVQTLRSAGPAGLLAFLERHQAKLASHDPGNLQPEDSESIRVRAALDAVGGQRDCDLSRLFWYTDLDAAKAAARDTHKPILSLRLLGKLTDEFSCANSRYFRTALYANHEISDYLREHFILHWQTERPAPRVTIDFGDGRKLETTLTGNSIHYVLDAEGRPFDALPGLYGPQAFLKSLKSIEEGFREIAWRDDNSRPAGLTRYHQLQARLAREAWHRELVELKVPIPVQAPNRQPGQAPKRVDARVAAARAMTKSVTEIPVLAAITQPSGDLLRAATTTNAWSLLGKRHAAEARLDESSRSLMRRQNGIPGIPASVLASSLPEDEARFLTMVASFENAMAIDTVRNEFDLRRQLHEWMAETPDVRLEDLNQRVYAELFLTPRSDAWLGLADPTTYTGLENGGRKDH